MKILGSIEGIISLAMRGINFATKIISNNIITADREFTMPDIDANDTLVSKNSTDTLQNKTIDADVNTVTNIEDDNIKVGAGINAEKVGSGSVDNTEFGYLDGVTSPIQTQIDDNAQGIADNAQALTDHILDADDAHDASAISYDNFTSGLLATDAQGAIDEVESRVDTNETNIAGNTSDISGLDTRLTTAESDIDQLELDTGANASDIADLQANKADKVTTVTGTDGLEGGGDLSANRTINIANEGVSTAKIAVDAVDNSRIADNAVQTENILNDAVTDAKISDVAASKITGAFPELYLESGAGSISLGALAVPSDATYINVTTLESTLSNISGTADKRTFYLQNDSLGTIVVANSGNIETGTGGDIEWAPGSTLAIYFDGVSHNVVGGTGAGGAGGLELVSVADTDSPVLGEISKHYLTNSTNGPITINLPSGAGLSDTNKKTASIRVTDSSETWTDHNVTLVPFAGEKIDGFAIDESFVLDVSGSWLELSWDDEIGHWSLNLSGTGGGSGGGGLTIEEYAYNALPANLELNVHYLVDFGGGSDLNAVANMPVISTDSGSIKVTPINNAGGCTITLSSVSQFNDPDLGLDTEYVIDVASAQFNTNVNDGTYEIVDGYWSTTTDVNSLNKIQRKTWPSNITTNTLGVVTFNNLDTSKKYKVKFYFLADILPGAGVELANMYVDDANGDRHYVGFGAKTRASTEFSQVFVGEHVISVGSSTLNINANVVSAVIKGNTGGSNYLNYVELTEVNNVVETTDFT